jgi:TPR repeat protein
LRAADSGDPASQFSVSVGYCQGQGVARDRVEAAKWWTLAMQSGGAWAERVAASVESAERKLTPEELAEGTRRAEAWQKAREAKK